MPDKLRVAIVGCGNIAEPYASTLGAYPQIELLGATEASFTQGRPVDVTSTFTPPAPMPWAL